MAIKGLSKMVVASGYTYDEGKKEVTYDAVSVQEKMTKYEATPNFTEGDGLYGDNGLAESAPKDFTDGDLTISTTELTQETSKMIYKINETMETIGDSTVKIVSYDKDTEGNVIGLGLIEEHQYNDVTYYKPIILPKIKFDVKEDSAETRGSSISWQTPELTGKIMLSDLYKAPTDSDNGYNCPWKLEMEWVSTETLALANIEAWFNAHKKEGS